MFNSDYSLATTGNAGPTKGDSNKEIGAVYIGLATPEKVFSFEFNFGNSRERVTGKSVNKSLELILKELLKNWQIIFVIYQRICKFAPRN